MDANIADPIAVPPNAMNLILNQMRDAGFNGIGGFLLAMMESEDEHIKIQFRHLVESQTAVLFTRIVQKHVGRDTTTVLDLIRDAGFDGIGGLLLAMLESDDEQIKRRLNNLVDSPTAMRFSSMVQKRSSDIPDGVFENLIAKMVREAQVIRQDKHCHIGAKGVTPEFIRKFSFQSLGLRFAELAPSLWRLVCGLSDIDQDTVNQYLKSPPEDIEALEESEEDDPEHLPNVDGAARDDLDGLGGYATGPPKKKHKAKEKVLAAIMVIAEIAFTRSRNCNAVQMMIGYYLFATRTGKRVMGVLNHLGISLSYDTVRRALQGNAEKVRTLITKRARHHPIALTYDNLTSKHHAATETLLNKSSMQCFTACGVIFLKLTASLAKRLGKSVEFPVPERVLPGESPASARARRRRPAARVDNKPGLRADLLINPDPDWSSLQPDEIVNVEADQKYWAPIAKALMCRVLKKFFPKEMKQSEEDAGVSPVAMPQVYKVPSGPSDMHTLATLQLDESTVDGNIAVLEALATDQLGLTLEELADGRLIPVSGDQMTVARITSGQFLRIRDFPEHRMLWAKTLSGMLHTRMALIHAIYLSHPGRPDGRDPASLSKFVKLLGRTKIKEGCPNLNASHELLQQVGEAHVLAALIERTGAEGLDGLRQKVASGEWKQAIDSIVDDDWLQLDFVDQLREDAREEARVDVATCAELPVAGETAKQAESRKKSATVEAEMEKRDIVFENALLLMQHALLYEDYHDAIRCGDSGRLERSSDILCIMFQGISRLKNYRHLSLDFKATRTKEWTDEMRELWLLNCVVNLTGMEGKCLAIDEFNEWIVRAVKDLYNTSGTIQSTKFTCEVVSPNVIPLHHASRNVLDSSGAPTYGYKHARVDDKRDVKAILGQLLEERVFSYNPGRQTTTNENLRAIPSKDLYCAGVDAIHNGDIIERYVKKKYALSAGELGAIDEDREAEDCDGDPEGGLDGLFANREPTWSMDEGGFSLED